MDEWILVSEDLPLRDPGLLRCSENVWILLEDGSKVIGFFDTEDEEWYDFDSAKKIRYESVVAWISI